MSLLEIELTDHAISRFQERVRPGLDRRGAEDELARLVAFGDIVVEPPAWHAERQRQHASSYLVVGDLVLPLEPSLHDEEVLCAVTCIARGGLSDRARCTRNQRRRRRAPAWSGSPQRLAA